MPRILGVDIPKEKRIIAALPYIYGIGATKASAILTEANIDFDRRAKDLTDEEVARVTSLVQKNHRVEGDLRRDVQQNIKRLIEIGNYQGLRHRVGLPIHGQRTKTNARTRKGRRQQMGGKGRK